MTDRVWIPVADADAWALATTVDDRDGDLVTLRRDGTDHTVQMTRAELEALPAAVLDEAVDDLTALSSVHDATMLDTLRRRHAADEIFMQPKWSFAVSVDSHSCWMANRKSANDSSGL